MNTFSANPGKRVLFGSMVSGMLLAGYAVSYAQEGSRALPGMAMENPPPVLNQQTFEELFATCRPCVDKEPWSEIAWVGEFWEGRQQAARAGKPMFIFAMNGHPLGCV